MKEITVKDCEDLLNEFNQYCETAEQHQFLLLVMTGTKLTQTIAKIISDGTVKNQKDTRAMFRVILTMMGKDYSEYVE